MGTCLEEECARDQSIPRVLRVQIQEVSRRLLQYFLLPVVGEFSDDQY